MVFRKTRRTQRKNCTFTDNTLKLKNNENADYSYTNTFRKRKKIKGQEKTVLLLFSRQFH